MSSAIAHARRRGSHGGYRGLNAPLPQFRLRPRPSVANLSPALTINGTTVYPTLRYKGGDAAAGGWAPWGYGETLTLQSGTAPSYNQGSPLLGTDDDSVRGNAGGYFSHATLGDVALEDIVLEAIVTPSSGTEAIVSKRKQDASYQGWAFYSASGTFCLVATQSVGVTATAISAAWTVGARYHVLVFVDRSGSMQIYVNGAASGAAVDVSAVGTLSHADDFEIFAQRGGANPYSGNLIYCALWKQAAWLDTHLQATVAATRFAQLCGTYPAIAYGTDLPTTASRSGPAYLDKVEGSTRKLYYVGANWIRTCRRTDSNSVTDSGLLIEPTVTNSCLYSEAVTGWSDYEITSSAEAVVTNPTGAAGCVKLLETATTGWHWHYRAAADGATNCISAWVRGGLGRTWAAIHTSEVAAYESTYFDLTNCAVGTRHANHTAAGISGPFGDGWYRIWITFVDAKDNGYIRIGPAPADATQSYAGDITKGIYLWGVQKEYNNIPSSYIPTTTAPVARAVDSLVYNGDSFPTTRGRIRVRQMIPSGIVSTRIYEIDDGVGQNSHAMANNATPLTQLLVVAGGSTEVNTTSTVNPADGKWHTCEETFRANFVTLMVDGTKATPDTSATMPTGITAIRVGAYRTAGYEHGGLINRLEIFNK